MKTSWCSQLIFGLTLLLAVANPVVTTRAADKLAAGFAQPPDSTKPWCYWYWISDNISKDGISRDLEAMRRVGIGEAFIGNIFLEDVPAGKIKVLSPEWWELVEHAIREGGRVGVDISLFNCPGWSQSGGPWITPDQTMRHLASSETRVHGPGKFEHQLPKPAEPFQDVAVLAFPAPQKDAESLAAQSPRVTCTPAANGAERLVDGDPSTVFAFPAGAGRGGQPFTIEIETDRPFTARTLEILPSQEAFGAECEFQVADGDGTFRTVRQFKCDRSNMGRGVGFLPRGPVTVAFAPFTAKKFRLIFTSFFGNSQKAELAEVSLLGAARLESFVEKQLGKMHPTPLPKWDTYLWPTQAEPDSAQLTVSANEVRDLSKQLSPDGTLRWDVPPGEWVILRTGMTPTGMKNSPASPEGSGLEVDKMNRELARHHFDSFIGKVLKRMPVGERKAFKRVVADSYEMGSQNWTDGFAGQFKRRYGYDPLPWLPVLTGRLVGSADQSERFLWDLRRLVADRIAYDYVGGLRELCHARGLRLWLENYGHWGFPSEFLLYGSQSDDLGGEFWATGDLGAIELRAASSAAQIYGRRVVSAEAWTSTQRFESAPWSLKQRGDWAFCEGINHFVLHVYIHQPWDDKLPGLNAWFSTEFNRHNTWFESGRAWIDYLRRCSFLLQQGTRVADVAYFIGEDAPKMTGVRQPELPPGCDFDYVNADVILRKLSVKQGRLALPHGVSYRALVLPELTTMRPEVLRKLVALGKAGAQIIGPAPTRSPSLEDFPKCDAEVRRLAAQLRTVPRLDLPPDFQSDRKLLFTHRQAGGTHLYFVTNPEAQAVDALAVFRVRGLAPELWDAVSGNITRPAVYDAADESVRLPLRLGPHGSVFVVFREAARADRIVSVTRDGAPLLATEWSPSPALENTPLTPGNFTLAVWVKPAGETTLVAESNEGIHGLSEPRNDVAFPPHGSAFGGANHAGSGLAVGRNGVVVFEHGASYFAPVLVHATPLTDWTHVAVVYREGQPALYLNGRLAHRGLRSAYLVHPAPAADAKFQGGLGGFESHPRALDESELTRLVKHAPQAAATAIEVTLGQVRVWRTGSYAFHHASGFTTSIAVDSVPAPLTLDGPWAVRFAANTATFDTLEDWTKRSEEFIRHFSGKAVYRKTFALPALAAGRALVLDLGAVRDLATVRLNGQPLGTLWIAPWQVDITKFARPGRNELEIEVENCWNNRLVGDAALPREQRQTYLANWTVGKSAPLQPAGLLGPVILRSAVLVALPPPARSR